MSRAMDAAIGAARRAGEWLRAAEGGARTLRGKACPGEPADSRKGFVTAMDERCEEGIAEALEGAFPEYGILGEERVSRRLAAERIWIVDPLDGTLAYGRGLGGYATAIGLLRGTEMVLAVVYLPERDELFAAEQGAGATLNGTRIRVSGAEALSASVVSIDHRFLRTDDRPAATRGLLREIRRLRVAESCSAELCLVACGRLDAAIRSCQPTYDYGMGKLVVEEAGGRVVDFSGGAIVPRRDRERHADLVAATPALVPALLAYLAFAADPGGGRPSGERRVA